MFAKELIGAAEQMILSSACAAIDPRSYYRRLYNADAKLIIDQSQFGHTEHGSFVIKVSCPLNATESELNSQSSFPFVVNRLPLVRRTTLLIYKGIKQLIQAIESDRLDRLVDSIKNSNTPIISSNFCEAITKLHDEQLRNRAEVLFKWAVSLPNHDPDVGGDPLVIPNDYFIHIDDVRKALSHEDIHHDGTFIGTVERLDGETGDDGHRQGDVIMTLMLDDGTMTKARLLLSANYYKIANDAHMAGKSYVKLIGRLHPGRQPRLITDISAYERISS